MSCSVEPARPVRSRPWRSLRGVALALALAACGPAGPARDAPNLLLVSIDTLRSDHCSVYGYPLDTTPELDRLAAEGVRFANAYAPMGTTMPSHATMFTGLYPIEHGIDRNGVPLTEERTTLAEVLRDAGYHTGAVVSSFAVSSKFGLAQGFDTYDDEFEDTDSAVSHEEWRGHEVEGSFERRAGPTNQAALGWFEALGSERPWFLWLHYFDPHAPYSPPAPYKTMFPARAEGKVPERIACYDGELRYVDHNLAVLLRDLSGRGLLEDTLLVVVGDHGEGLMDHRDWYHGLTLYEEELRVPMVLHWPGRIGAGLVIDELFTLRDLAPTLLELLGIRSADFEAPGRSFAAALLDGAGVPEARPAFFQRRYIESGKVRLYEIEGSKYGVRSGRWKYIEAEEEGTRELYDLEADPGEKTDLAAEHPELVRRFSDLIETWRSETRSAPLGQAVDEEDLRRLEKIGYAR